MQQHNAGIPIQGCAMVTKLDWNRRNLGQNSIQPRDPEPVIFSFCIISEEGRTMYAILTFLEAG